MNNPSLFLGFRSALFVAIARVSAYLPAVRGRTRLFLLLHRALGLAHHQLLVDTRLRRPVRFNARLDLQSWLQRIAFLTGDYEGDTVQFLHGIWERRGSRGYMLDIGANVGMICVPFALMASKTSTQRPVVVAVEAVPDNARALRRNVELNDLEQDIAVVETALGDEVKEIRIQVEGDLAAGEGSGTANILADGSTYVCVTQTLQLLTLDGLLDAGRLSLDCALIKIDTDGYDLKILQGGARFMASARPVVYGEFAAHCLRWHEQSIADIVAFAERLQYTVGFRQEGNLHFSAQEPAGGFRQDLLLVPNELRAQFGWSETLSSAEADTIVSVVQPP